jgi:hypothetical protein
MIFFKKTLGGLSRHRVGAVNTKNNLIFGSDDINEYRLVVVNE